MKPAACLFLLMSTTLSAAEAPPAAKIVPKKLVLHGDTRVDNYFWLREKTSPEVVDYLNVITRDHAECKVGPLQRDADQVRRDLEPHCLCSHERLMHTAASAAGGCYYRRCRCSGWEQA